MKRFLLLIFVGLNAWAQNNYQPGYFMMPIKPGSTNTLSGGFADLRTNHFHAGLDIRTDQIEGLPVYAAADGYVSRIKISPVGYGNALYITHPNGYTTLYGHLRNFAPKIAQILLDKQYEEERFDIESTFSPGEIPVFKGEIVAYSGNTGSSGGPHLHFEIRDAAENAINPLFWGSPEIIDNQAPVIERLIIRPLSENATVNGSVEAVSVPVSSQGNGLYTITTPLNIIGQVGFETLAYDRMTGSPFRSGINRAEVFKNDQLQYGLLLDKIPFEHSRDINAHIDYALAETNGVRVQKLYKLPGNRLKVYNTNATNGLIEFFEGGTDYVSINLRDSYGNLSAVNFQVLGQRTDRPSTLLGTYTPDFTFRITGNRLIVKTNYFEDNKIELIKSGKSREVMLTLIQGSERYFVYDLTRGLPDAIRVSGIEKPVYLDGGIGLEGGIYNGKGVQINFTDHLFEPLPLTVFNGGTSLQINSEKIPIKNPLEVNWTSSTSSNSKAAVYQTDDGKRYLGGSWSGNVVTFKTKELGNFKILYDYNSPTISPIRIDTSVLKFRVRDDLSGINQIRCEVNGEWLLMHYDAKSALIWSERYSEDEVLEGMLRLEVTDNCGNVSIFEKDILEYIKLKASQIKRKPKTNKKKPKKKKK